MLSTLWKKDLVEQGLSMRHISTLMLIGFFAGMRLWWQKGASPVVALLVPARAILYGIWFSRIYAEVFWQVGVGWG